MKIFLTNIILLLICNLAAQDTVSVTDQTIKVAGLKEEILYFGFAAGDKIIFNFREINNKELKEVEILEYPNNSKFSEYKTSLINNKMFTTPRQGIFEFRFKNGTIVGRVCKIIILRIPANEPTRNFNSAVKWITRQDTIWNTYTRDVVIGYDTTIEHKTRKELVNIDTILAPLFDKTMRVHSQTALGESPYTYAVVDLPKNAYFPNALFPYRSTEVIGWSYWLGVGQKSIEEYEKANKRVASGIKVIGALTGYGALAMLASTGVSMFSNTTLGENVNFRFYCLYGGQPMNIDYGNVVSASGRNEKIKQGSFSIELINDNIRQGIDVHIKMIVLQVSKTWEDIPYTDLKITARKEKQLFRDPVIKTYKIPVSE